MAIKVPLQVVAVVRLTGAEAGQWISHLDHAVWLDTGLRKKFPPRSAVAPSRQGLSKMKGSKISTFFLRPFGTGGITLGAP